MSRFLRQLSEIYNKKLYKWLLLYLYHMLLTPYFHILMNHDILNYKVCLKNDIMKRKLLIHCDCMTIKSICTRELKALCKIGFETSTLFGLDNFFLTVHAET
jgi:hypothetical protein